MSQGPPRTPLVSNLIGQAFSGQAPPAGDGLPRVAPPAQRIPSTPSSPPVEPPQSDNSTGSWSSACPDAAGWGVPAGAAAAFGAGADILLVCEDQGLVEEAHREIRSKLLHGKIPMERLHRSLKRIEHVHSGFLGEFPPVSLENVIAYFGRSA